MPRQCEVCGKIGKVGNTYAHRGRAKYLGGVGIKVTGISKRKFEPNLQKVRSQTPNGTVKRLTLCTQCIRSGKVTKPVKRPKVAAKVKAVKAKVKATA
jgi:large subunit ribosomal protein L28